MKTITQIVIPLAASVVVAPVFAHDSPPESPAFARLADSTETAVQSDTHVSERDVKRAGKEMEGRKGRRGELEEIVVTAQRREERLRDVPISISVLSGEELDRSSLVDATQLLSQVPGVSLTQDTFLGTYMVPVRGVANAGATSGLSTTGYYLDSVPFGFNRYPGGPDPDIYDLDRVEVLRGPQGTLYGASALNGVVRVLTNNADLDRFELKARGLTSSTESGSWNYRGDAAVNAPILKGKLAARAVFGYQDLSGWLDKPDKKNANSSERLNGRLKIDAQPTEKLSVAASAWFSRAEYDSPSRGYDSERDLNPANEPRETDYDVYGLHVGYDFPSFSLTSTTGYLRFENVVLADITPNNPNSVILLDEVDRSEVFSQEVAFTSESKGAWRWTAGGMYRDGTDHGVGRIPVLFPNTSNTRKSVSESYAVFGELTRVLLGGRFEVTGGMRYFEDRVNDTQLSSLSGAASPIRPKNTFSNLSPRAVFRWMASEDLSIYASYGEGFRSGMNQSDLVVQAFPTVEPMKEDTLNNYELGAKGSLWDRSVNFETAIYYIDWQDVQQQLSVPVAGGVANQNLFVNGKSVSGVGFDFAATGTIYERLQWGLNASWNDLAFDDDVISGNVLFFKKGDRPNNSVQYTAGASVDYSLPIAPSEFEVRLSMSANYTSEQQARTLQAGRVLVASSDPMLLARASLSLRAPTNWTATAFVDNLGDERGSPQIVPSADPVNNQYVRVRPRTIGVQIDYQY